MVWEGEGRKTFPYPDLHRNEKILERQIIMKESSLLSSALFVFVLILTACGGSGGGDSAPPLVTPTHTVTYIGNGATGGSIPIDTTNYETGDTVTVPGNTGNLVKAPFSFVGWNTASDGGGINYAQGQTFKMGSSNVILYAKWTINPTYTVTYSGNGATGGSVPIDTTNYEMGGIVTVPGNTGNLVKDPFSFVGWNTASDGSGTQYSQGNTFTMGSANVTLYAIWTDNVPCVTCGSGQAVNWPLRVSANGPYLEDQSGIPFVIIGDAAWSLAAQASPSDVITYLNNRQAKGFNAIYVNLIEHHFADNAPNNYNDDSPFTNGHSDWSVRGAAYWSNVDFLLNEARSRGILVLAYPAYLGYNCGSEGWCADMQAQTDEAMTDYGRFLGNRYKNQGNIIWVHGGDANCNAYTNACSRVAAIANGIKSVDTNNLHTASSGRDRSGMDDYNPIIHLNSIYSAGSDTDFKTETEYQRWDAKPMWFAEGYYENEYSTTVLDWQSQALIAYLGGSLVGVFFGNCPIWGFGSSVGTFFCDNMSIPWTTSLNSPGSVSMGNIGKLIKSRSWWRLVPDYANTVVTSSKSSGVNYHATARETNGETVMVWCPTTAQIIVDMTKVAGSNARAWWWNPDDNSSSLIGTFETTGTRNFTPSSSRKVLVLDDASKNLAAPGTTVY